nr:S9 family peptidase [Rhodothermaceae bacterium]
MKYLAFLLLFALPHLSHAQISSVSEADYQRAERFLSQFTQPLVYQTSVNPNWVRPDAFWYKSQRKDGTFFMLADLRRKSNEPLFDHGRLAEALGSVADTTFSPTELPITDISMGGNQRDITVHMANMMAECNLRRYTCVGSEPEKRRQRVARNSISPDGMHQAFIKDHNLWVRNLDSGDEKALTTDGIEDYGYATNNAGWIRGRDPVLLWSPDSKKIATFQHDGRGVGTMHMTSTEVGLPKLDSWKYPLPGDSVIFRISRVVIDVASGEMVRLNMPADPHRSTTTDHIAGRGGKFLDVRWSEDTSQLAFISSSRDHKVATLRIADTQSGDVRTVFEEVTETYYESGARMENWQVLFDSNEFIWFSERDNWGHLYLYDLETGELKNRITSGEWPVLQMRRVDEDARTIYFTSGGREAGDPYYHHFYSVNFDGSNLAHLTPEDANHVVQLSPNGMYFVDTYSTPVQPQQTVVRNNEGELVLQVQKADVSELLASGWVPPEEIKVKGRDGETDIYGLMYKPSGFDPSKKYPVLNYLYPGPQSGSVGTRSFFASLRDKQAVAELGFIVIEVDAMGTPGRSKSFHDAYYGNMGDNGIPDQMAAIKELGSRHDWIDLDKVGIWGHSGGGFASTRAILAYPEFYKVAVSGAGNHDNRNYEDDWAEKWQGLLETNPDG